MVERDKILIGALKECTTRNSVEETFDLYRVTDKEMRIDLLNQCMGSPQTFFSSEKVTVEETYELTLQMFLSSAWKLTEYYKRMQIGA